MSKIDIAFAPTEVYVDAVGKDAARKQAKRFQQSTVADDIDSWLDEEDNDILTDQKEKSIQELKMAGVFFVSGVLLGLLVGQMIWSP